MKILLIEDDMELCGSIQEELQKAGYVVDCCYDGETAMIHALNREYGYDLAVIDRMLPVVDGLTIIKAMRSKQIQIPVIIITGMSELQNKVEGLDSGADDYLSKPFHMEELSARIRALTRRPANLSRERSLSFHDISLDMTKRLLTGPKSSVTLTPTEFHLIQVFLDQPGTLLTREQLIQKVWETDASVETGNLDNYIYFLRKRIRTVASSCVLSSVYGSGYILEAGNGKKA